MTGTIRKLIADKNFGFIRAQNGQDVFFHASDVSDGFASLSVGQEVNFDLERGRKGPKASKVRLRRTQELS